MMSPVRYLLVCLSWLLVITAHASAAAEEPPQNQKGLVEVEIAYQPAADESNIPRQFRLKAHRFKARQQIVSDPGDRIRSSKITFPSPVKTPHERNNTVHCEYYRPAELGTSAAKKQIPGVVVLHILGGDFALSRLFCNALANQNVAALFVKLPYYGPRRQPGVSTRMIDKDPRKTVAGMRQAVLDIRRARAWLAARDEVDADQTGILGISLGGITTALAATAEPRFTKICPMLAGGDMAAVVWQSKEFPEVRRYWLARGGTKQSLLTLMKTVDPVTYGENVRGRKILMINALHDEVIPRHCTDSLWQAFGKPEIVWYDAGHYSAIRHILDAISRTTAFFQPVVKSVVPNSDHLIPSQTEP